MIDGRITRLHFRVKAATQLGQVVAVRTLACRVHDESRPVDIDSFQWETTQLVTTPEAYPIWYSKNPLIIPSSSQVRLHIEA